MEHRNIWMAVINHEVSVVFAKACSTECLAQKAIVEYLQNNENFNGNEFNEACAWIAEGGSRFDLMVFEMEADGFGQVATKPALAVQLPPRDKDGFRVVYVIDVIAESARKAAELTHQIMTDPDSLPPVLEVIDQDGNISKIDLNKS